MHLSPTSWAIRVFGSNRAVARAAGCRACSVIRWRQRAVNDVEGAIPPDKARALLLVAREKRLDLTADDLILGRDVPDTAETTNPSR